MGSYIFLEVPFTYIQFFMHGSSLIVGVLL